MIKKHKHNGIQYKSTGEYEIAKFLSSLEIEFEYEFPIAITDEDKTKIWYPDFYLKEYQVVVEYFGMYNHNENYKDMADHKKNVFKNCGIQFVPIYHINKNWQEYLLKSILSHQEMKAKKMKKLFDTYTKKDKNKGKIFQKIYKKFIK